MFFDDFNELGAERSFALLRAVGDAWLSAYPPIVARRPNMADGGIGDALWALGFQSAGKSW